MQYPIDACPIWGQGPCRVAPYKSGENVVYRVEDSPRAGGGYELVDSTRFRVGHLADTEKARLTTWLIDQRRQGVEVPRVTTETLAYVKNKRPLPVHERAERLLECMAEQSEAVGTAVLVDAENDPAHAWSESTHFDDVYYFLNYLIEKGWIQGHRRSDGSFTGTVTVDGYGRIADQQTNVDSSQAFVAMWFDDEMNDAYEQGIRQGIEAAGYTPMRIDRKPDVNKIDDEIIAEIRRSRFLVADFTHGEDGARGGVYYEAGFAYGLGLPVIYSCRADMVDQLHFDTRQYYHIVWETPAELRDRLAQRIEALIGAGPNK